MGGEKTESSSASMNPRGSPPRGRGKERRVVDHHPLPGITPAQAGKRIRRPDTERAYWDHPRVGGEKVLQLPVFQSPLGSPPRGRGKENHFRVVYEILGITPAWAGKRRFCSKTHLLTADHPRVGREKARTLIVQDEPQGSPPRRRGKGIQLTHKGLLDGITPARAGKSLASQPWSPPLWMMVIRPRP